MKWWVGVRGPLERWTIEAGPGKLSSIGRAEVVDVWGGSGAGSSVDLSFGGLGVGGCGVTATSSIL